MKYKVSLRLDSSVMPLFVMLRLRLFVERSSVCIDVVTVGQNSLTISYCFATGRFFARGRYCRPILCRMTTDGCSPIALILLVSCACIGAFRHGEIVREMQAVCVTSVSALGRGYISGITDCLLGFCVGRWRVQFFIQLSVILSFDGSFHLPMDARYVNR